jgi:hypothetical protein
VKNSGREGIPGSENPAGLSEEPKKQPKFSAESLVRFEADLLLKLIDLLCFSIPKERQDTEGKLAGIPKERQDTEGKLAGIPKERQDTEGKLAGIPKERQDSEGKLAGIASWGIVLFLLLPCVLAFPPFLTELLRHILDPSFVSIHKVAFKEWLDYSRIVLEITFAVTVSGSVFGEFVRLNVKTGVSSFYADRVKDFNERAERQKQNLRSLIQQFIDGLFRPAGLQTSWLFFRYLARMICIVFVLFWKANRAFQTLPQRLFWFTIWFGVGRFPAGLFGFCSFVLFLLITCVKIVKLYVDTVSS